MSYSTDTNRKPGRIAPAFPYPGIRPAKTGQGPLALAGCGAEPQRFPAFPGFSRRLSRSSSLSRGYDPRSSNSACRAARSLRRKAARSGVWVLPTPAQRFHPLEAGQWLSALVPFIPQGFPYRYRASQPSRTVSQEYFCLSIARRSSSAALRVRPSMSLSSAGTCASSENDAVSMPSSSNCG